MSPATTTPDHDVITDGFATAAARPDGQAPSDPLTVRGVAIGEGDVSTGLSGVPTRWPGEVLEQMEGMLEGKPITLPESDDPDQHVGVERDAETGELAVQPSIPLDAKVGEVVDDRYVPGTGLVFEAEVNHPDAEAFIERGIAHVSPVIAREVEPDPESEPDGEQMVATTVHAVRDLGMVSEGGMPSNEIAPGSLAAMTAEALAGLFPAEADGEAAGGDDSGGGGDGEADSGGAETGADDDGGSDANAAGTLPTDAGGIRGAMARRVARTRAPDRKTIKDGARSVAPDSSLARRVLGNQRGDAVDPEEDAVARHALGMDDEEPRVDRTPVDVDGDPVARQVLGIDPETGGEGDADGGDGPDGPDGEGGAETDAGAEADADGETEGD